MDRTPYFSVITGEQSVRDALTERGLLGAWYSVADDPDAPTNPQKPGQYRKLEWRAGDYTASALRFRQTDPRNASIQIDSWAIVLTLTASEQMAAWHQTAIRTLDKAAEEARTKGAVAFEAAAKRLMTG
jgi:hypothetical protein